MRGMNQGSCFIDPIQAMDVLRGGHIIDGEIKCDQFSISLKQTPCQYVTFPML